MNDLQATTEETLSAIAKAQTTGIFEGTGAWSYDLTGIVRLIPVYVPFRNQVPRESSVNGSPFAIWRAFMNVNASQPRATPGWDFASNEVIFAEQDFQAAYQPVGLANIVTQDAVDVARGLYDPYAEGTVQTLNQVMIAEDKLLIGAQTYALPLPAVPTVSNLTTGGSIAASTTVLVAVAARTGSNFYYGGNSQGRAVAGAITTTGSTSSLVATIPAVKGALGYDWFFSSNSGTTYYYAGTTTIGSFTFLSTLAANAAVGSIALPDLSTVLPTLVLGADNGSGQAKETNGLISTLTGDYTSQGIFTTAGTGIVNGAVFIDGGGAALTLSGGSITQIEAVFAAIWNQIKASPSAIMVNAIQAQEIANLILGGSAATTFLTTDAANRLSTTAGGRVGQIINTPAGGVEVPIEVHVSLPPGTIVFRTDRVPFPQAQIASTLAVRTLRDYSQFDYPAARVAGVSGGGPRKEFEIRSVQTLVNRAPVSMGILVNIS
jgi:hypothetical protein